MNTQPQVEGEVSSVKPKKSAKAGTLPVQERLKAERIQDKLKAMPGWRLTKDERAIDRARKFSSVRGVVTYAAHVIELAAVEKQPVHLTISGLEILVTLQGHPRRGNSGGLTDAVLDLAAQIV